MSDQLTGERIDRMAKGSEPIIVCRNVNKWFGEFHVLRDVTVDVMPQEVVVVIGPSGSGKSTFIRCINRLEEHQEGQIVVDGMELGHDVRNIAAIRREIGMVFQQFNLFPHLTVLQNITLAPMRVRHWSRERAEEKAMELLNRVGIPEQASKYPGQLSGGQQQRVAVVRAMAAKPKFILADEPTASLDSKAAFNLLDIMAKLNEEEGITFIFSTHDQRVIDRAKRVVHMVDGRIDTDERR